jgi:hypothetical protein
MTDGVLGCLFAAPLAPNEAIPKARSAKKTTVVLSMPKLYPARDTG